MKKFKNRKAVVMLTVLLVLAAAYAFLSRPMTIQQRYPMLTLDKCTGIQGYYQDDTHTELQEFTIDRNSEDFERLWELLCERDYRWSAKGLLMKGTRYHPSERGNFQWEVYFCFDGIETPDGNGHSGTLLRFDRWYDGELNIEGIGESANYHTNEQDDWAKEIFDIIR